MLNTKNIDFDTLDFGNLETNIKLNALDVRDKLTIIVLPILNKNNFMNLFKEKSEEVREELK